jgi:hypothetical protein
MFMRLLLAKELMPQKRILLSWLDTILTIAPTSTMWQTLTVIPLVLALLRSRPK